MTRMKIITRLDELRSAVEKFKHAGLRCGFVPTMGNLHDGHLALVDAATAQCDRVIVSIFVNPMQFAENEDFDTYPVTPAEDEQLLIKHKTALLYRPQIESIYHGDLDGQTRIEVPEITGTLCGQSRPHFFTGVATVVNTLFNQVQPDVAYFGKKDYQQYLVIRKMVSDLSMNLDVVGIDTVRLETGLAMSSRNNYLSAEEKSRASVLYQVLKEVVLECQADPASIKSVEGQGAGRLGEAGFTVDYLSVRRQQDLKVPTLTDKHLIVLAAAWMGKTRLIDNVEFSLS